MLFDMRTYRCRPGTLNSHLALYAEYGWPVQSRHLGAPALYASTETGPQNSYVHIWVYEDAADRTRKRATLLADPAWQDYLARSAAAGYLIEQENRLLTPTQFFQYPGTAA